MELSKKTTILFPPKLHELLARLAKQRGTSLGELVREACARQYGFVSSEERMLALRSLTKLALPVAEPARMKAESTPDPDDLLP